MFIYKITNLVNGKVYIGKTTLSSIQKRFDGHIRSSEKDSGYYLHKSIKKYNKENFVIEKICSCATKKILNVLEIFYIKKFNSMDKNIGYNLGKGGEGVDMTIDTRKKLSEKAKAQFSSPESRKAMSEAKKKYYLNPENKKKISVATKKAMNNPKIKKYMSEIAKERFNRPEEKKKSSERMKKFWNTPEGKQLNKDKGKAQFSSLEARKAMSDKMKKYFSDPENRKKISIATKKAMARPEVRKNLIDGLNRVRQKSKLI